MIKLKEENKKDTAELPSATLVLKVSRSLIFLRKMNFSKKRSCLKKYATIKKNETRDTLQILPDFRLT